MSQARARYLTAQKAFENASEAEKIARQSSDKLSPELKLASLYTENCGSDLAQARDVFYREFRELLAAKDPEFRRLEAHAQAATLAHYNVRGLMYELRKLLTAANVSHVEGLESLDAETQKAYARMKLAAKELGRQALDATSRDIDLLRRQEEEYRGRAYVYLEAALARDEAEEGRAA